MKKHILIPQAPALGLALCLLIPSAGVVQKYLGTPLVAVYLILGLVGVLLAEKWIYPRLISLNSKLALALLVFTFCIVIVSFAVVYPLAQSGAVGGGSDADDGLNDAAARILQGQYPYYLRTYLDNALSPLPGAIFLAVPFVLLGNSSYQNLFWFAAFASALSFRLRNFGLALALVWSILISPTVMSNIVTGTDYTANAIYVLLITWWMVKVITRSEAPLWQKIILSVLLGVALSSRSNFILILPLLFSALVQNAGWSAAAKYLTLTCLALAAITIPFWLYDQAEFSPLYQQARKVGEFETVFPSPGLLIPIMASIIAVALSFSRMTSDCIVLFRNCAIVQAFPVLCVVILSSFEAGRLEFILAGYGVFFLFFGLTGYGINWMRKSRAALAI